METSLIGKALDFGSKEYGFESRVSNIIYNYALNYVLNHLQINSNKKNLKFDIFFTKKNIKFIRFLKYIGLIKNFYLFKNSNYVKIKIFISFYKRIPICKNIKLLSTPSRNFFISYKALLLLHNRSLTSVYLLSTSKGLITHMEALRLRTGGKVVMRLSV